jgi:hypothetical protein
MKVEALTTRDFMETCPKITPPSALEHQMPNVERQTWNAERQTSNAER